MTIDPILPLSVSIAEGKGTYAIFLGSGASKGARIPTGNDILWDTVNLLYKLENEVETIDNEEDVEIWFNESKYKDFNYSDILENLCPTREERRRFLEKYFIDKEPSESHFLIADLVKKGLIKVILTTNFDRLMENALETEGIHPTIVSSEEELKTSLSREHSDCWILKLHGDYKRLNIRNTTKELEKLDDNIKKEFQEVLDKYGILVIGYSGSDEGIMSCFEKRDSKYTLYWLTRGRTQDNIIELINQQDGREIKRDTAEEFIKELSSKICIFQAHETGETPEFIMNEVKKYIRENDCVSLLDILKRKINIIRNKWYKIYEKADEEFNESRKSQENVNEILLKYFRELEEYTNIITAIGLILIDHSHESLNDVLKTLQEINDMPLALRKDLNITSWSSTVLNIPLGTIHNIYYCLGAYALKKEKFDLLKLILNVEIIEKKYNHIENCPIWSTDIFYPEAFSEDTSKIFKYLLNSYDSKDFLKEFFYSKNDYMEFIFQFNLILCLYSSKIQLENPEKDYYMAYPHFKMYRGDHVKILIFRMKSQYSFSALIAEAFGEIRDRFVEKYPERCKLVNKIEDSGFRGLNCNIFDENK